MFLYLAIGLAVVLALALLGFAVFLQTALDERRWAEQSQSVFQWRPPFIDGAALRAWAAAVAERVAAARLAGRRTANTPVQLAAEIEEGAEHAMLPLARQAELERTVACPESDRKMIGVTAPEALAIADYLRAHLPRSEQKRIHALAVENARKLALMRQGELAPSPLPCPLASDDNVCCAYAARPLRCRPLHAIAVAKTMESRAVQPDASSGEQDRNRHEYAVEEGIESGLTHALHAAGLDAEVYELNGALAVALETPHAAERWANGEHLFQDCPTCGPH